MLDPSLVALVAADPAVITDADTEDPRQRMLELEPAPILETDPEALVDVAAVFGDLADLKTPFTAQHSRAVAALSTAAAEALTLDAETVRRLQIAAHLHDIGRVGIGNGVWEKQGPLSSADWEQVRLYPYHSERIMTSAPALEPSARLAGMHQERLDGSGYHRGCRAGEIPVGARVLAAAHAFQAMTEDRPHRSPLTPTQAAQELQREARAGRLDADAVAAVVEAAGQRHRGRGRVALPAGLSQREVDVLRLVAVACSNREIGERLHISRRTAEHHVQHIYTKLGISTRSAAALFAAQHDLLPARLEQ
jgi:HD-GYP domain-containing protein (c-di-GMP phosphodiesterase class II)